MKEFYFSAAVLLFSLSAQAQLVCKGSASGVDFTYTLKKTSNQDLSLKFESFIQGKSFDKAAGKAVYSSTVKSRFMKDSAAESYYVFSRGEGSYTELIGISRDLQSMARSRPDPTSDNGNYIKLRCSGTL